MNVTSMLMTNLHESPEKVDRVCCLSAQAAAQPVSAAATAAASAAKLAGYSGAGKAADAAADAAEETESSVTAAANKAVSLGLVRTASGFSIKIKCSIAN